MYRHPPIIQNGLLDGADGGTLGLGKIILTLPAQCRHNHEATMRHLDDGLIGAYLETGPATNAGLGNAKRHGSSSLLATGT